MLVVVDAALARIRRCAFRRRRGSASSAHRCLLETESLALVRVCRSQVRPSRPSFLPSCRPWRLTVGVLGISLGISRQFMPSATVRTRVLLLGQGFPDNLSMADGRTAQHVIGQRRDGCQPFMGIARAVSSNVPHRFNGMAVLDCALCLFGLTRWCPSGRCRWCAGCSENRLVTKLAEQVFEKAHDLDRAGTLDAAGGFGGGRLTTAWANA